jgi:long-chain fatty acid transport protein
MPPLERARRPVRSAAPKHVAFAAGLAYATLVTSATALASGFSAAEFGGEHGNVVTTDPTALYFNPAGIAPHESAATGTETHLYLSGVLALRRGRWTHAQAASEMPEPAGAEGANTGEARFSNLLAAPALAATTRIRRFALGAAFYVPFGGNVHWDSNPRFANSQQFPLAADGIQRWHAIEGSLRSLYFTIGAGLRVGPLSVGATGNVIRSSVYLRQARSLSIMPVDLMNEGRIALDVSGNQASFGLGALVEALPRRLWFGASYQAQPGLGPIKLNGTLTISDGSGNPASRAVTYTYALPDIVRVGVRVRAIEGPRALELRAYGDLTRWSRLQTQCISLEGQPCAVFPDGSDATPGATTIVNLRRHWKDTYAIHVGASYWASQAVEVFAGVGFATAATPDETLDPLLPDAANVRFALGGRFALPARLHLTAGLTDVQFASRDNTGRSTLPDAQLPTRRPDGGGQYGLWLGVFQVSLEKQL